MTEKARIGTAMLIDDERVDQLMYRRIIERTGIIRNHISFCYAEDALAYLKQPDHEDVDVIFLDVNMPRMDGFEFLEAATAELGPAFHKAYVVMLTTSMNPSDRKRAEEFEVVRDFVSKPLTPGYLETLAGTVAQRHRM